MRAQTRISMLAALFAAAALGLAGCGKEEPKPAPVAAAPAAPTVTVKIGIVAPLTGPQAHIGKDMENAVRLAAEDNNAKKIMIGGNQLVFEVQAEDDQADPKMAPVVAQKIVDAKVNAVVGHFNSGTTIPASKLYSDAGIPQISPSATNPKYTDQGFKTTYRVVANDNQQGKVVGEYIANDLKAKSLAIIDDRTAYGQGVADEFGKGVLAAGGKTVGREFTNDKATDFTAILTNLKAKKPDIIFFGGMDAVAGPMLRQMKQLGISAKLMGGDGICSTELPKLAAGSMGDGQVVCAEAGGIDEKDAAATKAMTDFRAKFKAKFNAEVQI